MLYFTDSCLFFQFRFIPRFLLVQSKKKKPSDYTNELSSEAKIAGKVGLICQREETRDCKLYSIDLTYWINSVCMAYTVRRNSAFIFRNRISIVETNPIVYRRPMRPRCIQEVSLTLLKNISPAQFADLMASYSNRPSTLLYN